MILCQILYINPRRYSLYLYFCILTINRKFSLILQYRCNSLLCECSYWFHGRLSPFGYQNPLSQVLISLLNCGVGEDLRVPWAARRSNQSILKEISPEYSLEGLMLKLKLQYFDHLMQRIDSLEDHEAGKDWKQEEKGMTEDEMVGWHHWLNGHESEKTPGDGDGQRSLLCWSPWSRRVRHDWATELNWYPLFHQGFSCVHNNRFIHTSCLVTECQYSAYDKGITYLLIIHQSCIKQYPGMTTKL